MNKIIQHYSNLEEIIDVLLLAKLKNYEIRDFNAFNLFVFYVLNNEVVFKIYYNEYDQDQLIIKQYIDNPEEIQIKDLKSLVKEL